MKQDLQEYIKALSLKDKKSLSQKALKVVEETGELAKTTLPFENADGTTHRFVEKDKILEEGVDIILSAISMVYELGYSHEEIEEMMWQKAKKWQGIQAKEERVDYPIPYEIHVTVDLNEWNHDSIGDISHFTNQKKIGLFKGICKDIGVKPIVIDLEKNGKSIMKDVMTSSKHVGNNVSAYTEAKNIEAKLYQYGLNVVRVKIETVPWHPAAPQVKGEEMPEDCYFEAHIGCIIYPEEKKKLESLATDFNAHLSRNFFKKLEDGKFVNMITKRNYDGTLVEFNQSVQSLKKALKRSDITCQKVITEFSIYDTKVSHDFKWLKKMEEAN